MKPYSALLTFSTLAFTLGWGTVAEAEDGIALSFALEPTGQDDDQDVAAPGAIAPTPPTISEADAEAPLPIPPGAENPPLSGDTTWPAGVYGGVDALALGAVQSVQTLLPAPPPPAPPTAVATAPPEAATVSSEPTLEETAPEAIDDLLAWTPQLPPRDHPSPPAAPPEPMTAPQEAPPVASVQSEDVVQAIFEGGTNSLVARAVGSAEGTRTPEGHKNPAYFGHVDPGNGVWNLGTFSYQHGARSPEEADAKQLQRLQRQTELLKQKAQAKGLSLSHEELLNGIDLANQAPLAALDRGGYIDWLQEAHSLGMTGSEAIIWARTRSFIDPDTQRWNAPGLGNNVYSISHDQERRANAIARAIQVTPDLGVIAQSSPPNPAPKAELKPVAAKPMAPREDFALSLGMPASFMQSDSAPVSVAVASSPTPEAAAVPPAAEPSKISTQPTSGAATVTGLPEAISEETNSPRLSRLVDSVLQSDRPDSESPTPPAALQAEATVAAAPVLPKPASAQRMEVSVGSAPTTENPSQDAAVELPESSAVTTEETLKTAAEDLILPKGDRESLNAISFSPEGQTSISTNAGDEPVRLKAADQRVPANPTTAPEQLAAGESAPNSPPDQQQLPDAFAEPKVFEPEATALEAPPSNPWQRAQQSALALKQDAKGATAGALNSLENWHDVLRRELPFSTTP